LNTLERFHIHTEFTANNHLNENQTVFPNTIFDTLIKTHHSYTPLPPYSLIADRPKHSNTENHHHTQNKIQASLQKPHTPKYHAYLTTAVIFLFYKCDSPE